MAKQEVELYIPGLANAPGWVALNQTEQQWLQEHTSNAVSNLRQSGFKAIQACAELAMIEKFLEDKPLTMTNWMRTCLGASERTGRRWLANYKEMKAVSGATDEQIMYLAQEGVAGMSNIHQGDIVSALKKLPAPKDKRGLPAWKDQIGEALKEGRRARRKGAKLNEEEALLAWVLTARRVMREAKMGSSAEQRAWLKRGLGYIMELRAVTGTVTAERTPLPDGFLPTVGRPRKERKAA